jgi:hypothetical protein
MVSKYLDLLFILDSVISQISSTLSTSDHFHPDPELFAEFLNQRVLVLLLNLFEILI